MYLCKSRHFIELLIDSTWLSKSVESLLDENTATYDAGSVQATLHSVMPRASQLNVGGSYYVYGAGFVVQEPEKCGFYLCIHNSTSHSELQTRKGDDDRDDDEDDEVRPESVYYMDNQMFFYKQAPFARYMTLASLKLENYETLLKFVHTGR